MAMTLTGAAPTGCRPALATGRAPVRDGRSRVGLAATIAVAATWLVHGLYNKLLGGSPRHLLIVQAMPWLDGQAGELALAAIGAGEMVIAAWVLSGRAPIVCAATQTMLLLSMNAAELTFARDLLLWPAGLIPVSLLFLGMAWVAAASREPGGLRTRLRRHPFAVRAHLKECVTLTFAFPADVLEPLLPPGLELDTCRGYGFVAVALVQTRSLRPSGVPAILGQDFFLAGHRIFVTFRSPGGRKMRGLFILRSDANNTRMVVAGNLLTHYNYHRCDASFEPAGDGEHAVVRTADGLADVDLTVAPAAELPGGSPFESVNAARRYAGPLPFTFDYESETHSVVAIQATRSTWRPALVSAVVRQLTFFDQPPFRSATPILAAAFCVRGIDYCWHRGRRYPLASDQRGRESFLEDTRLRGVRQIVSFNWPMYVAGAAACLLAWVAAAMLPPGSWMRLAVQVFAAFPSMWLAGSLWASWLVYDRSPLLDGRWIHDALGGAPQSWINVHAGHDVMAATLAGTLDASRGRTLDIYDPATMTEPSIARARRASRDPRGEPVDFRRLPVAANSTDAVLLLLSAHELRTHEARTALFREVRRVTTPESHVVVAEHLRDAANLLAFGPGALHFHSRRTWMRCFGDGRFSVGREFRITPFVRVFVLRRMP